MFLARGDVDLVVLPLGEDVRPALGDLGDLGDLDLDEVAAAGVGDVCGDPEWRLDGGRLVGKHGW